MSWSNQGSWVCRRAKTKSLQRKRRKKFTNGEHRGAVPIMYNRCAGGMQGRDRGHTRGIYAFRNG